MEAVRTRNHRVISAFEANRNSYYGSVTPYPTTSRWVDTVTILLVSFRVTNAFVKSMTFKGRFWFPRLRLIGYRKTRRRQPTKQRYRVAHRCFPCFSASPSSYLTFRRIFRHPQLVIPRSDVWICIGKKVLESEPNNSYHSIVEPYNHKLFHS